MQYSTRKGMNQFPDNMAFPGKHTVDPVVARVENNSGVIETAYVRFERPKSH